MKQLEDFPRLDLGVFPTPFYKLENISRELGKNIYIKRDDMTGVALGGNKVRKLEFLLADAIKQGCDAIITTGGAQSNHAMLTAACCARLGLESHLVLKGRGVTETRGNLLLNDVMGEDVMLVDTDSYDDVYAQIDALCQKLTAEGKKPYVIPVGGSVPMGSLGYVKCARELFSQAAEAGVKLDRIVCCSGSGGTHAGLALGAKLYGGGARVTGIAISDEPFEDMVYDIATSTAALMESDVAFGREDVEVKSYFGAGYAIPSDEGDAAVRFMARREGLFLDPVYTGKTFAGLIDLNKKGFFDGDENIVFMHSGGIGGFFALY